MPIRCLAVALPLLALAACAGTPVLEPGAQQPPTEPATTVMQPVTVDLPLCPIYQPSEPELEWTMIPGQEIAIPFEGRSTLLRPGKIILTDDDLGPIFIPSPWGYR
jgi:hypothetical protein